MNARIAYKTCPLCNSDRFRQRTIGDCSRHSLYKPVIPAKIVWMQCETCTHVFTEGYFTPEVEAVVFATTPEHQKLGADLERQRMVASRIIEKVQPYVEFGVWLDVGFGNGALLLTAQEYGYVPIGTDLRSENVASLNGIGIEGHNCDIKALKLRRPCDVISLADVLEHMPFPRDGLAAARRLLDDEGVIVVSMPNMDSMLWRVLDVNNINPYWGELEHYHNFGRVRLYALLRECGFEPLQYSVSERYRACMEVIARKDPAFGA